MFVEFSLNSCGLTHDYEEMSFISYLRLNNLIYTREDYQFRLSFYMATSQYVKEFNKQQLSINEFRLGMNNLAVFTPSEYQVFLEMRHGGQTKKGRHIKEIDMKESPPEDFDWHYENGGKVYDVKDQGHCGLCWAFAAISAQASAYAIYSETNPVPLDLSEQNFINCDTYD
jgi:C1A family cysteine protease